MPKKGIVCFIAILVLVVFVVRGLAETPAPQDRRKHTQIGKYVTALQAYEMWKADPVNVKILDCRTREEYVNSGHPTMAHSIPAHVQTQSGHRRDNPGFEARVRQKFSLTDTILVICRAGYRSAEAVNRLAKAGFRNVYNIVDGFDGKGDGGEATAGWKNCGAPWTRDVNPDLL
jgi:rhodanese-related sulfurtransferase